MSLYLNQEYSLKNDFPVRFINVAEMQCEVSDTILKFSIDDVYIFSTVYTKQMADLWDLLKVWSDHKEKTSTPKVENKAIEEKPKSKDKDVSTMVFASKRVEILTINEDETEGAYMPLVFLAVDNLTYSLQSDSDPQ